MQENKDNQKLVYDTLDKMGISYRVIHHDNVDTMQAIEDKGLDKENKIAKNLFLRNAKGDKHYIVSVKKGKDVDLKKLREELSSTRLSFGSEERLYNCLKLLKGAVTPFGVLNDKDAKVIVAFDKELEKMEEVGFHPNDNSATVFLSFEDVKRVVDSNGNKILIINI